MPKHVLLLQAVKYLPNITTKNIVDSKKKHLKKVCLGRTDIGNMLSNTEML